MPKRSDARLSQPGVTDAQTVASTNDFPKSTASVRRLGSTPRSSAAGPGRTRMPAEGGGLRTATERGFESLLMGVLPGFATIGIIIDLGRVRFACRQRSSIQFNAKSNSDSSRTQFLPNTLRNRGHSRLFAVSLFLYT